MRMSFDARALLEGGRAAAFGRAKEAELVAADGLDN
jgi:hypothetical protein